LALGGFASGTFPGSKRPFSVLHPQDNTYGFLFFSKFPIVAHQVHHWTDKEVPTLEATLQLADEIQVTVFVIHPRPPRPEEGDSDQRDGELVQAGSRIQGMQGHFLVIGDLNDVAWSHTTRLFLRVSGLLDPRMGRGLFNTFHASYPFMRFPLDHVFFSDNFFLVSLERLGKIGSDHFPMSIEIGPQKAERVRLGHANGQDHQDVAEYKEKGHEWDSPDKNISD
jgi:endonuclease/exonuclease/phosphatase (EEP) superfamily protein YafD